MRMEVNAAYGSMAEKMASIPDRFEAEGTLLYEGRNTIKRFDDGGVPYVVKRFRRPMFVQRVVYTFFRPGKARRAYHYGLRLQQLGFATPESIAYLETRSGGLLDQSYYICRVDDDPPICERLNDPEEFDRVMAAEDFANDEKDGGEIGSGHRMTALYEIVPADSDFDFGEVGSRYQETQAAADGGDWLTVSIRAKEPEGTVSKLYEYPVNDTAVRTEMSENMRFAAAVTEAGMLLRDSEWKGQTTWAQALELARGCQSVSGDVYKEEFVYLLTLLERAN